MEENGLGATELNEKQKAQAELNSALQEMYEVKKDLNSLEFPKGYTPVSLSKYKSINLTGKLKDSAGIVEEDVYALELENDKNEKQIQLYILKNKELELIATINEKEQLLLSEKEKQKYLSLTRDGELDKPFAINKDEMNSEKSLVIALKDEKNIENKDKKKAINKDSREARIANSIGVDQSNVLMVVEIKDEVTLSRVLNKNIETKNLYAVKLRQDSGGVGSNDWVIVNQKSNGKFEQAMRQDPSDTMQDISQTVGLKRNNLQAPDLDPGDIDTVSRNGTRYTQTSINGTRLNDEYGILETQKDYHTTVHIAKEGNDGKAKLLCDEEHSKHEEERIEFPDRDVEIEDDKEDRTPGGDAYERRFEHRH